MTMASHDIMRIGREIVGIQKGTDLSIAVACQEADLRQIQALIIGPPETPYEFGFFEFSVKFGPEYPLKPPQVQARTTNSGRCRFNPNIYAGGKVCLSILGTWQGQSGEQWSPAQSLESVLLSIQSLMSNNPYENEPGYENSKNEKDKEVREAYCAKIQHETLRIAVIQKLESVLQLQPEDLPSKDDKPPQTLWDSESDLSEHEAVPTQVKSDPKNGPNSVRAAAKDAVSIMSAQFNDLLKRRFLWYYGSYLTAIARSSPRYRDGKVFDRMPFESKGNGMLGHFQYASLRTRLIRIKDVLEEETKTWAAEGKRATEQDLSIAFNLQNQFDQFAGYQRQKRIHNIDVSLLEGNPFVWIITYFGRNGTNLNGGMFRIRLSLSPKFPEEQPRVRVETRMYHHRVSQDGTLCYFPDKIEEVKFHIEAIVTAIEEVSPPYDPRAIVHAEATKLFWGNDVDKRNYARAQRRSAQDSMEEVVA